MYSVIIVEDDPMVAAINRQYVEMEPAFSVKKEFRTAKEALAWLELRERAVSYTHLDVYKRQT